MQDKIQYLADRGVVLEDSLRRYLEELGDLEFYVNSKYEKLAAEEKAQAKELLTKFETENAEIIAEYERLKALANSEKKGGKRDTSTYPLFTLPTGENFKGSSICGLFKRAGKQPHGIGEARVKAILKELDIPFTFERVPNEDKPADIKAYADTTYHAENPISAELHAKIDAKLWGDK